jgi:HK97 gp10 family phage protein
MRIDVEMTGIQDVYDVLENVSQREARNIMRATVGGMAGEIRDGARAEAPIRQGKLRKAIKVKRRKMEPGFVRADVIVEPRAFYWRFIHDGTVKQFENPFATRALEKFKAQRMSVFLNQFAKKFEARLARLRNNGR